MRRLLGSTSSKWHAARAWVAHVFCLTLFWLGNEAAIASRSVAASFVHGSADDSKWGGDFGPPGIDGPVLAVVEFDSSLVIAGKFDFIGQREFHHIARWDGIAWYPLGQGMDGDVAALAVYGGDLIAGGSFTTAGGRPAGRVARWDGAAWQGVGFSGLGEGSVLALDEFGGRLIAGGQFQSADGAPAGNIAQWDGVHWLPLGAGVTGGEWHSVFCLAAHGGALFAGGSFSSAGGVAASCVARWDGGAWSALGSGVGGVDFPTVRSLVSYRSALIALGDFSVAGGHPVERMASWDGASWAPFVSVGAWRLVSRNDSLLALVANSTRAAIERWDGSAWQAIVVSTSDAPEVSPSSVLDEFRGHFVVSGTFDSIEDAALWRGGTWHRLAAHEGAGSAWPVTALAVFDDSLFARGKFVVDGSESPRPGVARWDGSRWRAATRQIGTQSLVFKGSLYASGDFIASDSTPIHGVARWDAGSWHPLGSGLNNGLDATVRDLIVYGDGLVAVGCFSSAGGLSVGGIATWDGTRWLATPTEDACSTDHAIEHLAIFGSHLIAAGVGVGVRQWDGVSWTNVGGTTFVLGDYGSGTRITALTVFNDKLVVGGVLSFVGGARFSGGIFDGSNWSELIEPAGLPGTFIVYHGRLVAPQDVGGKVAQWDGSTWTFLGSGLTGPGKVVAIYRDQLYLGGDFTGAGGKPSYHIARWDDRPTPVAVQDLQAAYTGGVVRLSWELSGDVFREVRSVRVQRSSLPSGPYAELTRTPLLAQARMSFVDDQATPGREYWYRLLLVPASGTPQVAGPIGVALGSDAHRLSRLLPPFAVSATGAIQIRYSVGFPGSEVRLGIFDVLGREVRGLDQGFREPGDYVLSWDRRDNSGVEAMRGVYVVQLKAGAVTATRKLILLHR